MLKRLSRVVMWSIGLSLFIITTIYFVRLYDALNMMPLRMEHRITLEKEFDADMEEAVTWSDYLELENQISDELTQKLASRQNNHTLNRHSPMGFLNPENMGQNWNRSYVLEPQGHQGAAVLVHGLSDSPYSMRATAELFREHGLLSFVPRMPGHGFAVGSFRHAVWEDWIAVVRIAMREAEQQRQPGQPLILAGYSNGGLLAVRYVLDCIENEALVCPDGLLLLSPAIGVTPFARFGNWHELVSWIDYFELFQWQSILPEIDPFKFTSFPDNPGRQIFELSKGVHNDLVDNKSEFPRVLLFQSEVDDTVSTEAALAFVEKLPGRNQEVVVYDVNQNENIVELMKNRPKDLIEVMQTGAPFDFAISLITNRKGDLDQQKIRLVELAAGSTELISTSLDLEWPEQVYSLSHIAIPFAPHDPVYGDSPVGQNTSLGMLAPRGERNVLNLSPSYFLRLRSNPFYSFQEDKISTWLDRFLEK